MSCKLDTAFPSKIDLPELKGVSTNSSLKEQYFFLFQSTSTSAEQVMRENPDLASFLTLDLKTWFTRKVLHEKLKPIRPNTIAKELFVIVARVLVGQHTKIGQ